MTVDAGRNHELFIGMNSEASQGFDKNIDKVSPPPPPEGFYCYFPLDDSEFEFLNALWGDIRSTASEALWQIDLKRIEQPTKIVIMGLPRVGKISIEGIPITKDSMALSFPQADSTLKIEYSGGFWEEPVVKINFELPEAAGALITIQTEAGKAVRRLPDMWLAAGKQSIGWNAEDNMGNPVEPGIYYAQIKAEWGQEFTELLVDIVVPK